MDFIAIIPARYGSKRFPGKPLALLGGVPVICRVAERVRKVVNRVVVATDNERIAHVVACAGGEAVLTGVNHRSGTDRCLEAYDRCGTNADVVVNVQGDEPFICEQALTALMACFDRPDTDIATLVRPFDASRPYAELANPNTPKVVLDTDGRARYFSRSVIPYVRDVEPERWPAATQFYTHVGVYAYRADVLRHICALPPSATELAENLEQLRWLSDGLTIRTAVTTAPTIGIDTPDDLARAERFLAELSL